MSQSNKEEIKKTKRFIKRFKKTDWQMSVGLLVVIVLGVLVALVLPDFVYRAIEKTSDADGGDVLETTYRHPLTGVSVYEEVEGFLGVYGVMIDNHEDAWPPSGVDEAFLVVEAPVEAGISRMLAFFYEGQEIEKIGPVRSARPYYLDWNNELDALYTHVGGSNAALDLIASGSTFDFNQYWWGSYFWRSTDRYAPHNVYVDTESLSTFSALREESGVAPERLYGLWNFKDPEPTDSTSNIRIDFNPPVYSVDWEYNSESGRYERWQFDSPHVTDEAARIEADNVAVVITDVSVIDGVGRRKIRTTGVGDGYVLQDGLVIEVEWRKPSASERLRFYVGEEEVVMNAGVTWIEVVPSEESIEIE
ncbi:MAG: DUF3048 domain-containing protein [Parcubacteria group bacterium]|nr:DUF3048 domain-containing protein [Parcubacteria group bacterium]